MKSKKRTIVASLIFLALVSFPVLGQIPNSMFFMPGVPQSNRINPAIQPGCGFYLGFPGLAPLRFEISSSSLGFSDLVYHNAEIDSLITPFHPLGDKQAFLDELDVKNMIISDFGVSLASFGFRSGKSFISFDISSRLDGNIYFPRGIFDLAFTGAVDGGNLSLGGFGADITAFNEIGLGWSRKDFLIPNLDLGVRGKVLFGLANVATKSSVLDIATSLDEWNLHSEMEVAISAIPLLLDLENYEVDFNNFEPPPLGFETIDFSNPGEILDKVFTGQFGLGVDVGLNYRPIPQLMLSASMLDIGYINWKNSQQANFNFDYDFAGIEVNPFTGVDTTMITELLDSLGNSFVITAGAPYMTRLNSKLFIGASYYPIEKIGFGLLSRTDFLNNAIAQQFTGTVNMTTGKFINLSLSYSYMQKTFNNIGAGLSFNLGPLNMYLISDNIISAGWKPLETRSVNLWFGMNLTFGWHLSKKKAKPLDRPMII